MWLLLLLLAAHLLALPALYQLFLDVWMLPNIPHPDIQQSLLLDSKSGRHTVQWTSAMGGCSICPQSGTDIKAKCQMVLFSPHNAREHSLALELPGWQSSVMCDTTAQIKGSASKSRLYNKTLWRLAQGVGTGARSRTHCFSAAHSTLSQCC